MKKILTIALAIFISSTLFSQITILENDTTTVSYTHLTLPTNREV